MSDILDYILAEICNHWECGQVDQDMGHRRESEEHRAVDDRPHWHDCSARVIQIERHPILRLERQNSKDMEVI